MRLLLRSSTRAYRGLLDFAFGSPCLVDGCDSGKAEAQPRLGCTERSLAALLGGQADANQEAGMVRRVRQHDGTIVLFHHGLHDRKPKPTASRHIVAG